MSVDADDMESLVSAQPSIDGQVYITDVSYVTTDVPGPTTLYKIGAFENNVDCTPFVRPANRVLGSWDPS